jgi:AcrR family transcriptional regulator
VTSPDPAREGAPAEGRPYGGLSPQERRDRRRRRLLDTALELFAAEGYAGTSIERLCSVAGVTTRNLYEEFSGRDGLLAAVFEETSQVAVRAVEDALAAAPADPLARIEAAVRAFVRVVLEDPRRAQIQYVQVGGVSADLERRRRVVGWTIIDLIRRELERAAALGLIPVHDHRWTALGAFGAADTMIQEWVWAGGGPGAPDVLADEVVRVFLAVVSA